VPELVEPNVSGWLVPAGAIDELVVAMREVLTAPPERLQQMGRAGAARVARQHDVAIEAGKLAQLHEGGPAPVVPLRPALVPEPQRPQSSAGDA
jgi:glycosyltransferase involved in cell wall biosynthesis